MQKTSKDDDNFSVAITLSHPPAFISQFQLVEKQVSFRFCEYKISNLEKHMHRSQTTALSLSGLLFDTNVCLEKGTLLRVWLEIPNYWSMKSKFVDYRQTEEPTYFQILSRVLDCGDQGYCGGKYQIASENLNINPIDENVLREYLGIFSLEPS